MTSGSPGRDRRLALATLLLCGAAMLACLRLLDGPPLDVAAYSLQLRLLYPRGLAVFALVPGVVVAALLSLADLPLAQRWLGAALRSLLLLCLGVALTEPVEITEDARISAVVVVDVSDSVPDASLERARALVAQVRRAAGDHDVKVVSFAEDARRVQVPDDPERPVEIARHADAGAGTDTAAALRLAQGLFEPGHVRRALLISDGLDTRGRLLSESVRAAQLGLTLHAAPLLAGAPAEVGLTALEVPGRVQVGEPFALRVDLFATQASTLRLRVTKDGRPNPLDPGRELTLERGRRSLQLRSVAHVAGPTTYRVELAPETADRFESNNQFEQTVFVEGSPRVLLVDPAPSELSPLSRALGAGAFEVEVRSPAGLPTSRAELGSFDFVVLSDTPIDALSRSAIPALERYVEEGGGLLVAGGGAAFGLGGYGGTRLERLLPVRMESERRRDRPTLAMALVIDKSGSMDGRKIRLAKEAARATAEVLGPEDYIGVIGFDTRPQRVVRMQSARNRLGVSRDVGRLAAGGGTAIFPALDAAYGDLAATRARLKHVILLTDGQTDEAGLPVLVRSMRADGITVSTIGLGEDVHRSLLTELSRVGGGRSYFTATPHNIPRLFVRETHEVARSAAVEERVQPRATARASFLEGVPIPSAPPLRGYVATRLRGAPAQAVLATGDGEPLLARVRKGLGWSLAWTSDLKARWAVDWLRWPSFSRFVSQLVRAHMRERPEADLPLEARLQGDELRVAVDVLDADDRFRHGLEGELVVRPTEEGEGEARATREVALHETAPGRYTARLPLTGLGSYSLRAHLHDARATIARASGSVARPFPAEYARFEPQPAALEAAAAVTGGRLLDSEITAVFEPPAQGVERHLPRWPLFVWAALVLVVLDLWVRRVRLWPR